MTEKTTAQRLDEVRERKNQAILHWQLKSIAAEEAIDRVRELHQPFTLRSGFTYCTHCVEDEQGHRAWPCPTVACLDGGDAS